MFPDAFSRSLVRYAAPLVALGLAIQTLLQSFSALTFALLYFDLVARPAPARHDRAYQRPRGLDE